MKTTILKWGYWMLGAAFGIMLCLIAREVLAQTCSPIGQFVYCDSSEGSTIVAPTGNDRGIIMEPGNRQGTYWAPRFSRQPEESPWPDRVYLDRERPRDILRLPSLRSHDPEPEDHENR